MDKQLDTEKILQSQFGKLSFLHLFDFYVVLSLQKLRVGLVVYRLEPKDAFHNFPNCLWRNQMMKRDKTLTLQIDKKTI